ncbi:conserved hypothetical protein [Ricinus communis]|uniref:Uncharacterized protein n=1 Tax=Ricinus communis TaxID=3988 RepID=B9T9Z9_RICCO|nr:conserved hypothetical protein [Ricinus communis]
MQTATRRPACGGRPGYSAELDLADGDGDHQRLRLVSQVGVAHVDQVAGRHADAVEGAVVVEVVHRRRAAADVDIVVVASQLAVLGKVEGLFAAVGGDAVRIAHLQPAQRLAAFLPRRQLLEREARLGKRERQRQVIPDGVADEVGQLRFAPWRLQAKAGERVARRGQRVDHRAVGGLDDGALRRDRGAAVRRTKRRVRGPLAVQVDADVHFIQLAAMALQRPQNAALAQVRGQLAEAFPALQAAVGGHAGVRPFFQRLDEVLVRHRRQRALRAGIPSPQHQRIGFHVLDHLFAGLAVAVAFRVFHLQAHGFLVQPLPFHAERRQVPVRRTGHAAVGGVGALVAGGAMQHGRAVTAAEDGVGQVVRERQAGEAHLRREGPHQHRRHRADHADEEAGQGVQRQQQSWLRAQRGVEHVDAGGQQQRADEQHRPGARAVGQHAIADAAQRQADRGQRVGHQRCAGVDVIDLLQQRGRHQDHHHNAGRQHPGQQHGHGDGRAVVAQHGLERHFGRQRLASRHVGKHRRLMQPAAQIHGTETKHPAQQERPAPGAGQHLGRLPDGVEARGHQRAKQDAEGQAGGQHAAGVAGVARRHVLGHEHPGAGYLAAHRRALQHAHQQQQQRGGQADAGVGRQQADGQRRHGHQQDRQREHALAAQQVAKVRHDDAAQRPHHVAGGEDAEGLQGAQPFRHLGREEQLADGVGEEDENDEIVEFQRAAEGGQRQCLVILAGQRPRGGGCGHMRRSLVS